MKNHCLNFVYQCITCCHTVLLNQIKKIRHTPKFYKYYTIHLEFQTVHQSMEFNSFLDGYRSQKQTNPFFRTVRPSLGEHTVSNKYIVWWHLLIVDRETWSLERWRENVIPYYVDTKYFWCPLTSDPNTKFVPNYPQKMHHLFLNIAAT